MAITLLVNGVPLTVDSGANIAISPTALIQLQVDGQVVDPATLGLDVTPPDVTLTLPDGQVVTLAGFVDPTGQSGGGLLGADGATAIASSVEALTQAAAGPPQPGIPSPEQQFDPAAGGPGGPGGAAEAGGSSLAVSPFTPSPVFVFGASPGGDVALFGFPPFDVPVFDELPLLLGPDAVSELVAALGEFLLFTDSLILPDLSNPGAPDDFAFFNNPAAPIFNSDGSFNLGFNDASGSSGNPVDLNVTNGMNGNDTVELADKANPNGNNLKELFGTATAFYGGTGDDTVTGGNDHDIIVGDGQEADNASLDCGDDNMDHDEKVVIKGDDDTLDGGIGNDVLLGDGLVTKPGFDSAQRNIGFPNLVSPPTEGPAAENDPASIFMPSDLLQSFMIGMFGPAGIKNVLDIEIEKQNRNKIKLAGGDDTLLGGEGEDLAVGDALFLVEGRSTVRDFRYEEPGDREEPFIEQGFEGDYGDYDEHHDRPQILAKGGDDLIDGGDGGDKLIGDGIARLPSSRFDDPHGGKGYEGERGGPLDRFVQGLSETKVRLEGGDDTIIGDDGSEPVANVVVFDNGDFVDTDETGEVGPLGAESDEIQANLDQLGHNVSTFTGITASEIAAALAGQDALVIPEQEVSNVVDALSEEALDVIRAFVRSGGKLIFAGDHSGGEGDGVAGGAAALMNALFDYGVTETGDVTFPGSNLTDAGAASSLGSGPDELPHFGGMMGLTDLPAGAISVYEDEDGNSTVAIIPEGQGEVVYFGWDWFSSANPAPGSGDESGQWSKLLDTAVRPGSDDTMIGDGILNISAKPEPGSKRLDAKVAVFDNELFVDTEPSGPGVRPEWIESDEVQATLDDLGHKVTTFEGFTAEAIAEATKGKDVLLIPDLENGDLGEALSDEALEAIRDFVRSGGKVVVHGTFANDNDASLLNAILGSSLERHEVGESFRTPGALGTPFEKGPSSLAALDSRAISNLPTDGSATSLYETEDGLSTVVRFSLGHGSITYIGNDWSDFSPEPGGQEGDQSWIEVLDIAVSPDPAGIFGGGDNMVGGRGADNMAGDGLVNIVYDKESFSGEPIRGLQAEGPENGIVNGGGISGLVKGGDDIMHGDAEGDSGAKSVVVFNNGTHVDTDGESQELQDTLKALGHEVMTFTGVTAAEIEEALEGKDVLVIPETEDDSLVDVLTEDALDVIREFVRGGGKMIVHGEPGDANALLAELFGYGGLGEVFIGDSSGSTDTVSNLTGGGRVFEGGPATLPDHGQVSGLTGLPGNAVPIYQDESGNSTVALFEEGLGHAVFIGWDWFSAAPAPGDRDGGWVEVLRRAVEMDMGASRDVMLGDAILDVTAFGEYVQNNSAQVAGGEGYFNDSKTLLKGGDDTMFGGQDGDVMVGDGILDGSDEGKFLGRELDSSTVHEIWFDEELLFSDLTGKHYDDYRPRRDFGHETKMRGGDDVMFGGFGDDLIRGDGLWELAEGGPNGFATSDLPYPGGPYGEGELGPRYSFREAENAKGGHDIIFGGAGHDSAWGEGGHDFITGDGLVSGISETFGGLLEGFDLGGLLDGFDLGGFGLIGLGGDAIATADNGDDDLLGALTDIATILNGFENLPSTGGFLNGGNDYLSGGDDDRGFDDRDLRSASSVDSGHGHHDNPPFWNSLLGLDDVILGDGLAGLTGSLVPLLELPIDTGEGGTITIAEILGIDTSTLDEGEPLQKFTSEGGDDTIEGNSGDDLLAGDAIVYLNVGVPDVEPSPLPIQTLLEEGQFGAFIQGGDDTMWGDDAKDHHGDHKQMVASSDWDDHEVGYDDFMFGDLLVGIDLGGLLSKGLGDEGGIGTANDTASPFEIFGGGDTMAGGRGEDVIYGDGILFATGFEELLEDDDEEEPLFASTGGALSLFSTLDDFEISASSFTQFSVRGGSDLIFGDQAKKPGKHDHHDHYDDKKTTSDSEWFDGDFDDQIIGDGILVFGGVQIVFSGHDEIYGGYGNDVIVGDGVLTDESTIADIFAGHDTIDGGAGDDLIYGDALVDDSFDDSDLEIDDAASFAVGRVQGDGLLEGTRTTVRGGEDTLQGGKGDDTVYGEGGGDTVDGGGDIDIVFGGVGSDLGIWGDPFAEEGPSTGGIALPDKGLDNVDAVVGQKDYYDGNFGNFDGTTFTVDRTPGGDDPTKPITGGSAESEIDFDTLLFALSEAQLANGELLAELLEYQTQLGTFGGDAEEYEFDAIPLVAVEWEDVEFSLFWCPDHVAETLLANLGDSVVGDSADNMIVGTDGNDGLAGDNAPAAFLSDDIILGLDGLDRLFGDTTAKLIGGFGELGDVFGGDDKLIGGGDGDTLVGDSGGFGNSEIRGTADGDAFGGDDKLFGDYFKVETSEGGEQGVDLLYGDATGFITTMEGGRAEGGDDLLVGGGEGDTLIGDAGQGISGSGARGGDDKIYGDFKLGIADGGNDVLIGDTGDMSQGGEALGDGAIGGDDLLVGGGGNDSIAGDTGRLIVDATGGNDTAIGDWDLNSEHDEPWSVSAVGGNDFIYGDARFGIAQDPSTNGGPSVGGDDDLIGDSRIQVTLGDHGWTSLPSIPAAGDDRIFGDSGTNLGNSTSPVGTVSGGADNLYGDNLVDITLGGSDGYGYNELSLGSLDTLLASGNDTMAGDAAFNFDGIVNINTDPASTLFAEGGEDFLVGDGVLKLTGAFGEDVGHFYGYGRLLDTRNVPDGGKDVMSGDALGRMNLGKGADDVLYGDFHIELEDLGEHLEYEMKDHIRDLLQDIGVDPTFYGKNPYPSLDELLGKLLDHLGDDDLMFGDAQFDMTMSQGGNDVLHGQGGNDTMFGDAGDDMLGSDGGSDSLFGGGGDDYVVGDAGGTFAKSAGEGAPGSDLLDGGKGDDTLIGDAGDSIEDGAVGGSDEIYGGYGDDDIYGDTAGVIRDIGSGGGNDALFGGHDNDFVVGDAASIGLGMAAGNDFIDGGKGDDTLIGDVRDSAGSGSSLGDDSIVGGDGDDRIYGDVNGVGARGDEEEALSYSKTGDDTMDGGAGSDSVFGGSGSDLGIWRGADHGDGGTTDLYDGGGENAGFDTAKDSGDDDMDTLRLILTSEQFDDERVWDEILRYQQFINDGDDNLAFDFRDLDGDSDTIDLTAIEWEKIEVTLEGCEHVLSIDPSNTTLFDTGGSDFFLGTAGDDFFNGRDDADSLVGDPVGGALGNDVLVGDEFNDTILGDANADLDGTNGANGGRGGDDKLFGGEGSDTIVGDTGVGIMLGGGCLDTEIPLETALVEGADGTNLVNMALGGDDLINGGPNSDRDTDSDGVNYLYGDAYGDVKLASVGGNDSIEGGQGIDLIYGDAGHNIGQSEESGETGEGSIDVFFTPSNDEEIEFFARGGNDRIAGDGNNDTISGDAGGDIIGTIERAEGGDDFIVGDQLEIEEGPANGDQPVGDLIPGDGDDLISGDAGNSLVGPDAAGGDDVIYGDSYLLYERGVSIGTPVQGGGADSISGDAGGNLFDGARGGDDLIFGQGGGDVIAGDALNDFFGGGTVGGDDIISGGSLSSGQVTPTADFHDDVLSGDANNLMFEGTIGGDDIVAGDDLELFDGYGRPVVRSSDDSGAAGDDLIYGDARTFIEGGRGGNDWLVGDNLAIIGFVASYGDAIYAGANGGDGYGDIVRFRPPRFESAGEDTIVGDSGDLFDGAIGGDDVIFGDNYTLFVDGAAVGYGDGELPGRFEDRFGEADKLFGDAEGEIGPGSHGGNDLIYGQGGGDLIVGDAGSFISGTDEGVGDPVPTSGGDDTLYGGGDEDTIFGDTADFLADATGGNDTLFGGDDDDTLVGDASESFDARNGNDWLFGGDGNDVMVGDALRNSFLLVKGLVPDSSIFGDDDLKGGYGNDVLVGDLGSASIGSTNIGMPPEVLDDNVQSLIGQVGGNDLLEGDEDDDILIGDSTGDIRDFVPVDDTSSTERDGAGGNDTLVGGTGNDRLIGDARNDIEINAEGGDDSLFGDEGDDILIGDADRDVGDVADRLIADGPDRARGGNDSLFGGSGYDILIGDAGDELDEGATGGNDLLEGGSGGDSLAGDAGNNLEGAFAENFEDGEEGDDTLIGRTTGGDDTLKGGEGDDFLSGDAGNSFQGGSDGGNDTLFGGDGDDSLFGDVGGIALDDEADSAPGLLEADSTGGDDTLLGGAGEDLLVGDAASTIEAGATAGDDLLFGGDGSDILIGDAQDDVFGEAGDDTLTGDGGEDIFVVNAANNGADIITDFDPTGDEDVLRITHVIDFGAGDTTAAALDAAGVTVADNGTDVTVTFGGTGGSVVVQGIGDGTITSVVDLQGAIDLEIQA